MWSVEMRASSPRNATVLSSGIAASIGATSVATADRPLAPSRSRTVLRYWTVDNFISGETPGSPPPDGHMPNAVGVVGTGVDPPAPPTLPALPAVPAIVVLPPAPGALLAIWPVQATSPHVATNTASASTVLRRPRRGARYGGGARILPSTTPGSVQTVQRGRTLWEEHRPRGHRVASSCSEMKRLAILMTVGVSALSGSAAWGQAADETEPRNTAVYGVVGYATPLGFAGLEAVRHFGPAFELAAGLGVGMSAALAHSGVPLQWAVMPRVRVGRRAAHVVTFGAGASGGNIGDIPL